MSTTDTLIKDLFETLDNFAQFKDFGDLDVAAELDNDPGYSQWLDDQAMMFEYSHARMPGE